MQPQHFPPHFRTQARPVDSGSESATQFKLKRFSGFCSIDKITITSIPIHNGAQDRPQRDQGDYLTPRHSYTNALSPTSRQSDTSCTDPTTATSCTRFDLGSMTEMEDSIDLG